MQVKVIISYYNERNPDDLSRLLDSMDNFDSGHDYTTLIVVNRALDRELILPEVHAHHRIVYRQNIGYNIGAWDYAWRLCQDTDFFLFLQDDCKIVKDNWLRAFVRFGKNPKMGLIGESISWKSKWSDLDTDLKLTTIADGHFINSEPSSRIHAYYEAFRLWGIDPGDRADHVQSLVWAARRDVLLVVDGFPHGANYGEAIAAEIATSRKINTAGYHISQVHWRPFHYISHPQWMHKRRLKFALTRKLKGEIARSTVWTQVCFAVTQHLKKIKLR